MKVASGVIAIVVFAALIWHLSYDRPRFTEEELMAIEVGWASIPDTWDKGDKWHVEVVREGDVFFVTWPNPPDTSLLQGDFRFRVQVRAKTYEVIAVGVGS